MPRPASSASSLSDSYALSPMSRVGSCLTNRAASVACTSLTSCGVAVACLVRRITVRKVSPRCPGPQDPQDAIEHGPPIRPRATATLGPADRRGQDGFEDRPLRVGYIATIAPDGLLEEDIRHGRLWPI